MNPFINNKLTFIYSKSEFQQLAQDMLSYAKKIGASNSSIEFNEGDGFSVFVRKGEIEIIEQNKKKNMNVIIYIQNGKKIFYGNASTSDFCKKSLYNTINSAYNIARFTASDNFAGLPDEDTLEMNPLDLKLYTPWFLSIEEAKLIAYRCENEAFNFDSLIVNHENTSVTTQQSHFLLANSYGFMHGYPFSRHIISISPIAVKGKEMQRDYWYSSNSDPRKLDQPEIIGFYAAKRAISRLKAKKLSTRKCPILFEAPLAIKLLNIFAQAISGNSLYRKSTFLDNSLGKKIFNSHIQIIEDPHILGAFGSSPFDNEGVKTQKRLVVKNGIIQGYFLSTYSAKKLGMKTTGNSGGAHHLIMISNKTKSSDNLKEMLKKMNTGLLVTELIGDGINYITGDYSKGAFGYWIENGEIQYSVEEITIASKIQDMFKQIIAIGSDVLTRNSNTSGSILIENMIVAGN
ncbi:metalloprotease PmbA [Candidatus Profftella armatura (Diaphorina cf. continua)]|uniref:Metalloprotease PmbA n=1 Tax=Candidatus Profftella armatura (Diaphorina cf. continua) TaxID=2661583 RepID=A0A7R6VZF5_9PROT|nr:metallopeptidase TldD-related protein [Candidatus Profftella armatura (Diaphorina cf. continua)]BCG49421.1 metalloprotease PmbA [Candidatus Profftella armatura (Diaphorina cf. continua)]